MTARRHAAGLFLLLAGCQPFTRVPMPAPVALPRGDRAQVWVRDRPVLLREVVIEADTIRGRAVTPLTRGDSVVIPLADVDSIRLELGDQVNSMGIGVLGGVAAGVTIMVLLLRNANGT